jgi:hypothetical protein
MILWPGREERTAEIVAQIVQMTQTVRGVMVCDRLQAYICPKEGIFPVRRLKTKDLYN